MICSGLIRSRVCCAVCNYRFSYSTSSNHYQHFKCVNRWWTSDRKHLYNEPCWTWDSRVILLYRSVRVNWCSEENKQFIIYEKKKTFLDVVWRRRSLIEMKITAWHNSHVGNKTQGSRSSYRKIINLGVEWWRRDP